MTALQMDLVCCTEVIINEIRHGLTQQQIALPYAMAIRSEANGADKPDWPTINAAIQLRWSDRGLERVKAMARDLLERTGKP